MNKNPQFLFTLQFLASERCFYHEINNPYQYARPQNISISYSMA